MGKKRKMIAETGENGRKEKEKTNLLCGERDYVECDGRKEKRELALHEEY